MRVLRFIIAPLAFFAVLLSLFLPYVRSRTLLDIYFDPDTEILYGLELDLPIVSLILCLIICALILFGQFSRMFAVSFSLINLALYAYMYYAINYTPILHYYGIAYEALPAIGYYMTLSAGMAFLLLSMLKTAAHKEKQENAELLDDGMGGSI